MKNLRSISQVIRNFPKRDARIFVWQSRMNLIRNGQFEQVLESTCYDVSMDDNGNESIAIVCQAIAMCFKHGPNVEL